MVRSLPGDAPFGPGLLLGLLVLICLGDGAYRLLRRAGVWGAAFAPSSWADRTGQTLLLGPMSVPGIVLALDLTGIPLGRLSLAIIGLMVLAAGLVVDGVLVLRPRLAFSRSRGGSVPTIAAAPLRRSPAGLVFLSAAASMVLVSLVHSCIMPVRSHDALVGWDLVGKIMAAEGRFRSSVFTNICFNAQAVYAPFTSANMGFWYIFHPATSRLWVPWLTLGFVLVVWRRLRGWTGSPAAAGLASFLMLLPQPVAFALTDAQTDLPSMVFVSLAIFSAVGILRREEGMAPAALYLLAAATARVENLLFGLGLAAVFLVCRDRGRLRSLWLMALPLAFSVFWNLIFVRGLLGYDLGQYARPRIDMDPARYWEVLRQATGIIRRSDLFGEFYIAILAMPFLWGAGRWKRTARWFEDGRGDGRQKDLTGTLLLLQAFLFVVYLPFFYMWNPDLKAIWTMDWTFKRGFLRFVPGIMAALVAAPPVLWFLRKCDGRAGEKELSKAGPQGGLR